MIIVYCRTKNAEARDAIARYLWTRNCPYQSVFQHTITSVHTVEEADDVFWNRLFEIVQGWYHTDSELWLEMYTIGQDTALCEIYQYKDDRWIGKTIKF